MYPEEHLGQREQVIWMRSRHNVSRVVCKGRHSTGTLSAPTPIALPPLSQLPQHLLEGSLRGTPASFLFILLSMAGSTLQNLPSSTHSIAAQDALNITCIGGRMTAHYRDDEGTRGIHGVKAWQLP